MKRQNTFSIKDSEITRKWYLVDAKGKTLGRLATKLAGILTGKGKPTYTPNQDTGDFVVLINAAKVKITGKKETQKTYFTHSGYPGGDKLINFKKMVEIHPDGIIRNAVWGMLPQNSLGRVMLKKLKIYSQDKHDQAAQMPEPIEL